MLVLGAPGCRPDERPNRRQSDLARPIGGTPLLSARGETKLDAAGRAQAAFLDLGADDRPEPPRRDGP